MTPELVETVLSFLSSLCWPGVALVALCVLKRPVRRLIAGITRLNVKGVEFDFEQSLGGLEPLLAQLPRTTWDPSTHTAGGVPESGKALAEGALIVDREWHRPVRLLAGIDPRDAVIRAWQHIEKLAFEMLETDRELQGLPPGGYGDISALQALAQVRHTHEGLVPESVFRLCTELMDLRDEMVHRCLPVSRAAAREYTAIAGRVCSTLYSSLKNLWWQKSAKSQGTELRQ